MRIERALLLAALLCRPALGAAACMVDAANLSFGTYDPLSGAPATTSGTVVVTCNEAPPPIVTLQLGPSATSGGFFPRRMRHESATETLAYNFYADPGAAAVWGDGSGGTVTLSKRVQKNKAWVATLYGIVPPSQDVAAGSYSDSITLTIDF